MVRGALLLTAGILAFSGVTRAADGEPPIEAEGSRGIFLRAAHARIHPVWVESFLRNTQQHLPATHPLNRRDLSVVLGVTLIPDGTTFEAVVEKSSGVKEFDAAAVEMFRETSLPQPPDESLSDDGRAHLRWRFARDHRQCSGLTVVLREAPLEEALPRLLTQRQDKEALRRVRLAAVSTPESALASLARGWLARALEQTVYSVPAAIGLAGVDDLRGVEVLRDALSRNDRVTEATAALVRLKLLEPKTQPVPPPRPAAETPSSETLARQAAKGELAARIEAAAALVSRSDEAARQALSALARGAQPELRLFGAVTLDRSARAKLMAEVGPAGRQAFRTLVRGPGPGRAVAGEWLISQFETLAPSVQVAALSDWVWNSREASPITLSAR